MSQSSATHKEDYEDGNRPIFILRRIAMVVVAAAISAVGLHVFVYPAHFAPSGVDGIATMLQEITSLNAGYFTVILNLPLLIAAYFILRRRYVIYTVLFTFCSSGFLVLLEEIQFYQYTAASDVLLSAIFSGVLLGARTGIMLRLKASSGGVDVAAAMIQKKRPYLNIERIISIICYIIIGSSYFLWKDLSCILLSLVQMIVFEWVVAAMLRGTRNATEVKIITKNPEELQKEILFRLQHGGTLVASRGMYTDGESTIICSVINNRQIPEFLDILKKYPDTFVYYSPVNGVRGNFRWFKDDAVH